MSDEQIGAAIRSAAATVSAPPALRERLAAAPPERRRRRVPRVAFGAAAALVAVVLALVVTSGGPTVQDVAAAVLRAPTAPAHGTAGEWAAIGRRSDTVDGRRAETLVFRRGGRGVHYAIVAGKPIDQPDGRAVTIDGQRYVVLRDGRTSIVTWRADGHTCILASKQVGTTDLLDFLRGSYR